MGHAANCPLLIFLAALLRTPTVQSHDYGRSSSLIITLFRLSFQNELLDQINHSHRQCRCAFGPVNELSSIIMHEK